MSSIEPRFKPLRGFSILRIDDPAWESEPLGRVPEIAFEERQMRRRFMKLSAVIYRNPRISSSENIARRDICYKLPSR